MADLTEYAAEGFATENWALGKLGLYDVSYALKEGIYRDKFASHLGIDNDQMQLLLAFNITLLYKMFGDGFGFKSDGTMLFVEICSSNDPSSRRASLGISKFNEFCGELVALVLKDGWIGVCLWETLKQRIVADGRPLNVSNRNGGEDYYWISRDDLFIEFSS